VDERGRGRTHAGGRHGRDGPAAEHLVVTVEDESLAGGGDGSITGEADRGGGASRRPRGGDPRRQGAPVAGPTPRPRRPRTPRRPTRTPGPGASGRARSATLFCCGPGGWTWGAPSPAPPPPRRAPPGGRTGPRCSRRRRPAVSTTSPG